MTDLRGVLIHQSTNKHITVQSMARNESIKSNDDSHAATNIAYQYHSIDNAQINPNILQNKPPTLTKTLK